MHSPPAILDDKAKALLVSFVLEKLYQTRGYIDCGLPTLDQHPSDHGLFHSHFKPAQGRVLVSPLGYAQHADEMKSWHCCHHPQLGPIEFSPSDLTSPFVPIFIILFVRRMECSESQHFNQQTNVC